MHKSSAPSTSNHDSSRISKSISFNIASTPHHPFWLIIIIILQYFLLSAFFSDRQPPSIHAHTSSIRHQQCENGKVFVYDLPPMFNTDLLKNCDQLDPFGTKCDGVANGGFGPKTTSLETVVPENLLPVWYWTDMYISEVIYHKRMLNYICRTKDPEEATAFYIPFYAGISVGRYLFNHTVKERDRDAELVLDWVKNQSSWSKRNGSDHFIVIGRLTWTLRRSTEQDSDWGSKFLLMPLMKNVFKLSVERNIQDELEVSIPYPTSFHPRSSSDILEWQKFVRTQQRTSLFCFVGAPRTKIENDFRGLLLNYCKSESGFCKTIDCSKIPCNNGAPDILKAFLHSDFCLQPKGDGATRRSFFDCMLAGSIPVYFSEDSFVGQYQWHVNMNTSSSSVFINDGDVRNDTSVIRKVLEGYSKELVRKMRDTVIDMIPRFLYAFDDEGLDDARDAFDIAIEGVLSKFQKQQITIPSLV